MANATATASLNAFPNGRDLTLNHIHALGTITVAAGDYPADGIPLSFGIDGLIPADTSSFVIGRADSPSSGFIYRMDSVNQTLRIFTTGTASGDPLNELTSGGAVPAGVTGDTIYFDAVFNRS